MRLVALFPKSWRRRYGEEFEALLEDTSLTPRDVVDLLHGVWDAHLRPQPHLSMGGRAMSGSLTRGLWSVPAALAALLLMVGGEAVVAALLGRPNASLDPYDLWLGALALILGVAAAGLWRWARLPQIRVFLALLAARSLQLGLTGLVLSWSDDRLAGLYYRIDPLGLGWLPGTLFMLAAGVALVVALARWLRLRLVTALVVGLALELLVGASDLSLISYLRLHGLEEALFFLSSVGPAEPGQVGPTMLSPISYLTFVGPVLWAFALQQVALRTDGEGAPRPLARAYAAFVRAHWAPLAALVAVVALARFALPAYLTSPTFLNPAHFTPSGTNFQAQYRDCLKSYGVNLPPGASTKTVTAAGPSFRCQSILSSYPAHVTGKVLPVPQPVTVGGVTYAVTSLDLAGNLLKIAWKASGPAVEQDGAIAYPPGPPPDSAATENKLVTFDMQYLESAVLDGAGKRMDGYGGGGELSRIKPYAWYSEIDALVPGAGRYQLTFGCASPVQLPLAKGSPAGGCAAGPYATIEIVVG